MGNIAPLILGCCALALAQENVPRDDKPDAKVPTFQSKVDLVLVPVVVRGKHRRTIGNLTKDDFRLFDNGKPQAIASFSTVERTKGTRENDRNIAAPMAGPQRGGSDSGKDSRERYFIYLFDDVNIRFADMANVRSAALSHFQNNFAAGDHAAVYSLSGKTTVDFTTDRESLEGTVSTLRWGQVAGSGGMQCPDVSYYIADLIMEKADGQALAGLTNHTAECAHVRPELARMMAMAAAGRELIIGARNTQLALSALRRAVRRLSGMPGQRVIVLASPGFFAQGPEAIKATAEILDLAAKCDVIINGLSVRGVILAEEEEDVTRSVHVSRQAPPRASSPEQLWIRYRRESARADGDVMNDLAEGTGGIFFHNNNDLRIGFERAATAPEFSYVLGFSPSELKPDGAFHSLRVRLQNEKEASVEARRGYYALKPDPKVSQSTSLAELEDAVFSRDERSDLPVVLQTGYSKPKDAAVVKVLATAKVDVTALPHRETGGRSLDSIDVAATLFDQEGGYVAGTAEAVSFGPLGATPSREDPAVTLHWEFPEIKPGNYVVRLVIREPRSKAITTINRTLLVR